MIQKGDILELRFCLENIHARMIMLTLLINMFTLKEYFFHLFEEPADDVTWLKNKQPGTYTIHFDLIIDPNSFSFELHTRDEIIHFSEHNPKHDISLEKGETAF